MTASDADPTAELSLRVSRFVRAPRERVFEAWIRPELRREWWGRVIRPTARSTRRRMSAVWSKS